jgi:hypothetical protein
VSRVRPWLQVGFLPRREPAPWPAWALLVAGLGLCLVAALDWREASLANAEAEQALHSWQAQQRPARPPAAVVKAAPVNRETPATAQRVSALLGHRWGALFTTLEDVTPAGMQWLRLEHEAEAGEVQIEGIAPAGQQALQVVDALSATPGWQDVALSRLETGSAASSSTAVGGLRFEVRAHTAALLTGSP